MGKTILIIDDDPEILNVTTSMFSKRGFQVMPVASAEEALDILKTAQPDLIVTDVLLPQINGYDFLKLIKSYPPTADIPVIVITGRTQMKEVFDIAGVSAFIPKPFSPEQLVQKVYDILGIKESVSPALQQVSRRKKILIVGRADFQDVLDDILDAVGQLNCEGIIVSSVPDAVAQTVENAPDGFIIDVQLDGKHSAELVGIIRHLPGYEEHPILGFCCYRTDPASQSESRQKIDSIQEDARRFADSGSVVYLDRYARCAMIEAVKERILSDEKKSS